LAETTPRGIARNSPPTRGRTVPGRAEMINRTTRGGLYTRRMAIIAGAMLLISFALGFLIHPMY